MATDGECLAGGSRGAQRRCARALSALLAVVAVVLMQVVPGDAAGGGTAPQVTNRSLLFSPGEPLVFTVVDVDDESDWTVRDHRGELVGSGVVDEGRIVLSGPLPVGHYTLEVDQRSQALNAAFGVLGEPVESDRFYSVQTLTAHARSVYRADQGRILPMLSELGFSARRDALYWSEYERGSRRSYASLPAHREALSLDARNGTDLIWTAGRQNSLYGASSFPTTPSEASGYAGYIDAVLTEFPQIKRVELLNEFNSQTVNTDGCGVEPRCYLEMLEHVYPRIKREHPEVEIIAGGLSGVSGEWTQELLDLGGGDYMDAFSIHPYNNTPDALVEHAKTLRERLVEATGEAKPIYFSEFGYTILPESGRGGRVADERHQAIGLIYAYNAAREGGVSSLNYYNAVDYGSTEHEHNFGLFADPADRPGADAYQPKEAAMAFHVMRQKLDGYVYSHRDILRDDERGRVTSYVYEKPNGDTMQVMWRADRNVHYDESARNDDTTPVAVRLSGAGRAHTYVDDYMGANLAAYDNKGLKAPGFEVSLAPVYVESTDSARDGVGISTPVSAAPPVVFRKAPHPVPWPTIVIASGAAAVAAAGLAFGAMIRRRRQRASHVRMRSARSPR